MWLEVRKLPVHLEHRQLTFRRMFEKAVRRVDQYLLQKHRGSDHLQISPSEERRLSIPLIRYRTSMREAVGSSAFRGALTAVGVNKRRSRVIAVVSQVSPTPLSAC